MTRSPAIRLLFTLLLCSAVLLRVAIPTGYMPATSGSGLWFELCPEHVPEQFYAALNGAVEEASSHMTHAAHAEHLELLDQQGHSDHDEHECPFGHLLSSVTAVDQPSAATSMPAPLLYLLPSAVTVRLAHQPLYQSRAPPA